MAVARVLRVEAPRQLGTKKVFLGTQPGLYCLCVLYERKLRSLAGRVVARELSWEFVGSWALPRDKVSVVTHDS